MEIPMEVVNHLKEKTGAGTMVCKKALVESGGDVKKAESLLLLKGLAKRAKGKGIAARFVERRPFLAILIGVLAIGYLVYFFIWRPLNPVTITADAGDVANVGKVSGGSSSPWHK